MGEEFHPATRHPASSKCLSLAVHLKFFDILLLLEPTSPIRSKNDIDNALKKFSKNLKRGSKFISSEGFD